MHTPADGTGQTDFATYLAPVFDSMFEGIQIIDFDWRYVYLNATAASHGRRAREELIGVAIMDAYPGIDQTEMFGRLGVCMTERTPQTMTNEFVHVDGARSWFNLRMHPVPMGVLILSIDITEERATEERLREAQKLEAIGRLAGGIAHDFNNLLTVIAGYSDLILSGMSESDRFHTEVAEISAAGQRAAALTRQLLAFGRRQRMESVPLDLNDVVRGMETLLERLLPENIRRVTRLSPGACRINGDQGQIEQMVMNLALNARDAMPAGGTLTISTATVDLDDAYLATHPDASAGPHVVIAVSDTGVGMDDSTRARIFEPFFTTKEQGKGTGLGLATVYGLVKQNDGSISVDSVPGRGTIFRVYLPRAAAAAARSPARRAAPPRRTAGTATILLVEDDAAVRAFIRSVLVSADYVVYDAGNAADAIELLRGQARQADLLLTDVMLPRTGGRELARQSLEIRPDLLILYMSGYTEDAILESGGLHPNAGFIDKPVTAHTLLARLQGVLADREPAG